MERRWRVLVVPKARLPAQPAAPASITVGADPTARWLVSDGFLSDAGVKLGLSRAAERARRVCAQHVVTEVSSSLRSDGRFDDTFEPLPPLDVWAPDATPSAVVAALTPPLGAAGRRLVLWRDGERIDVSRLALWMRLARDVALPWVAKYAPAAVPPVVEPTWQIGDLYRVEDDANDIARVETALALVWPRFSMSATEPATTPDSPWIV